MTIIDEDKAVEGKAVSPEAFCPFTTNAQTPAAHAANSALTDNGAYTADVLRIVRGIPNAEELAALVTALLLTRRAHDRAQHHTANTLDEEHHRPSWLRDGYTPPGAWTAGP